MKKIKLVFSLLLISAALTFAQTPAPSINPLIADIINSYAPWTSAEFNGKIKNDRLPLSPTIKMYMQRDSLIQISLRAPLVGEVARVDVSNSEILIVNKLKRTFCRESADKIKELYPGLIGDLQSLFLARVVVLGSGELGFENFEAVEISDSGEGEWLLVPTVEIDSALKYGYLVGANGRNSALVASIKDTATFQILYSFPDRGERMQCEVEHGNKKFEVVFDFSSVKWGGTKMAAPNLDKYQQLDPSEFMKSFAN